MQHDCAFTSAVGSRDDIGAGIIAGRGDDPDALWRGRNRLLRHSDPNDLRAIVRHPDDKISQPVGGTYRFFSQYGTAQRKNAENDQPEHRPFAICHG